MDAARALFTKCTEVNENNAASWQAWGTMERQAGNREKAASLLERGLRVSPKNTWVMQALALLEWERGNTEKVCVCVSARRIIMCATPQHPSPRSAPTPGVLRRGFRW